MGHLLGYARVSTTDQQPQLQVDALERAGCYRVFTETASGARADRPTLEQLLDQLRPGDTLVVWKLDRLGRSLRHLVDTVTGLADRGIGFRSLQEAIDTTTPGGKLVFHIFAALAEFERDLIRERTAAGLAAARARGPPRRPALGAEGTQARGRAGNVYVRAVHGGRDCHDPWSQPSLHLPPPRHHPLTCGNRCSLESTYESTATPSLTATLAAGSAHPGRFSGQYQPLACQKALARAAVP
jgi:Resolvase, N terminal domain